MSAKHTPGPWRLSKMFSDRVAGDRTDGEGTFVADCSCNGEDGNEQDAANARLIAAAPDLLDALKNAVELLKTHHFGSTWQIEQYQHMYYAIKKATGEAA